MKLIVCTACNDGIRRLRYSDIDYSEIFVSSLLTSLQPGLLLENTKEIGKIKNQ